MCVNEHFAHVLSLAKIFLNIHVLCTLQDIWFYRSQKLKTLYISKKAFLVFRVIDYQPTLSFQAVFNVEYVNGHHVSSTKLRYCTSSNNPSGMSVQFKTWDVDAWSLHCDGQWNKLTLHYECHVYKTISEFAMFNGLCWEFNIKLSSIYMYSNVSRIWLFWFIKRREGNIILNIKINLPRPWTTWHTTEKFTLTTLHVPPSIPSYIYSLKYHITHTAWHTTIQADIPLNMIVWHSMLHKFIAWYTYGVTYHTTHM